MLASERQQDARAGRKRVAGLLQRGDLGPVVAGLSAPGRAGADVERHAGERGGGLRVGGDPFREGVGGVDQARHALLFQKGGKPFRAAEAASADLAGDRFRLASCGRPAR